jgi:hypothetical protein
MGVVGVGLRERNGTSGVSGVETGTDPKTVLAAKPGVEVRESEAVTNRSAVPSLRGKLSTGELEVVAGC